jgi:hypothetical protein
VSDEGRPRRDAGYFGFTVEAPYDHPMRSRQTYRRRRRPGPVKTIHPDGRITWSGLGRDVDAMRAFLEEQASDLDLDLTALARPFRRGRLTEAEQARRRQLAELVHAAVREFDATGQAIADALNLDKRRVAELVKLTPV